jgi:hypothetical protein
MKQNNCESSLMSVELYRTMNIQRARTLNLKHENQAGTTKSTIMREGGKVRVNQGHIFKAMKQNIGESSLMSMELYRTMNIQRARTLNLKHENQAGTTIMREGGKLASMRNCKHLQ